MWEMEQISPHIKFTFLNCAFGTSIRRLFKHLSAALSCRKSIIVTARRWLHELYLLIIAINVCCSTYVVFLSKQSNTGRSKRAIDCSEEFIKENISLIEDTAQGCYATAELTADQVKDTYTLYVGDDLPYGKFRNRPLEQGARYSLVVAATAEVAVRVKSDWCCTCQLYFIKPPAFQYIPEKQSFSYILVQKSWDEGFTLSLR